MGVTDDDMVVIDIHVIAEYGTRVVAVYRNVIKSIRCSVESLTGTILLGVNVCVHDLRTTHSY